MESWYSSEVETWHVLSGTLDHLQELSQEEAGRLFGWTFA